MTKKRVLHIIAFTLIFSVVLYCLCDLFESENTSNMDKRFSTYRTLAEDTVDAVILGSSGMDRYWLGAKAYEEHGMTVYPLSTDAMPAFLYINMIEEAYTYQNPELIMLDVRSFTQSNDNKTKTEARVRRVIDSMEMSSINRLKTIFNAMEWVYKAGATENRFDISYLLSFVKYHSKWAEEDFSFENNLGDKQHQYAGFFVAKKHTITVRKQTAATFNPEYKAELDPLSEEALYELIDYIKEKKLNVLFVDTPQFREPLESERASRVYEILEEEGMDYIHFYSEDTETKLSIDLDVNADFYNDGHVNYYGAEKFTAHFAKYLDEKYDFPDHRNDEAVKAYWDGRYAALKTRIKQLEAAKK